MIQLYGIKNCDTVRKARKWLDQHLVEYRFHDLRSEGLDEETLMHWTRELGWENLLNRRGTTWRNLAPEKKAALNAEKARTLILENTSLVKRPILSKGKSLLIGFNEEEYRRLIR